jgi:iron complex outermembrane recepter protein
MHPEIYYYCHLTNNLSSQKEVAAMNKFYKLLFITLMLCATNLMFAQRYNISGVVKDASTGEKLVGANILIPALGTGAATNTEGAYKIENVKGGTFEITVTYIGYNTMSKNIKIAGDMTLDIALNASSVLLNETVVKSTKAVLRETPIAFSEVSGKQIETKLSSRDLPMALATTPSVYASLAGGGAGDANMVVRGFDQKNIAVMINGVPVNDMEGKTVYWSNWAGLGEVTANVQVQRGLGASPYSINAVGGVLNVTTAGVGTQEEFVKIKSEVGADNLRKYSVGFHQKVGGGVGVTALVSRRTWDGFAVGTGFTEWTYYFAVGTVVGNHSFELQAVGSPQWHGQRTARQLPTTWAKYGNLYNASVGRLNGGNFNEAQNQYHKPAFNLNWNWQISPKTTLSTTAYYSFGRGWGSGMLTVSSANAAKVITSGEYAGYKDYDAIWKANSLNLDKTYSTDKYGLTGQSRSLTAQRVNYNSHDWMGVVSTFKTVLSPTLNLTAGIDARYYIGYHYQELYNILGGDYWVDIYKDGTGGDINNQTKIAHVGDNVGYYYEGHVRQLGGFGQLEYKQDKISAFVNVSLSSSGDQRLDKFNFKSDDPARETEWVNFIGYTAKAGLNYNLTDNHSIFANVGMFSTPPTLSNIFVGFNSTKANTKYGSLTNEKILGFELGYQYSTPVVVVRANGFYTSWKDRAFTASITDPATTTTSYQNIVGSSQLHIGGELEAIVKVMQGLEVIVTANKINAEYQNDVNATISTENGAATGTFLSYVSGLKVYGFPQTQAALEVNYTQQFGSGISAFLNPVFRYNADQYAFFSVDNRKVAADKAQSYMYPNYSILDLHAGVTILLTESSLKSINLGVHVFNLLNNTDYIVDATDGSAHDVATTTVFYGRERWINFNIGFNF